MSSINSRSLDRSKIESERRQGEDGARRGMEREEEEEDEAVRERLQESFERASADLEILCAAYPEEVAIFNGSQAGGDFSASCNSHQGGGHDDDGDENAIPSWFPLVFTLTLPPLFDNGNSAIVTMELPRGYPTAAPLQIVSYRGLPPSSSKHTKDCLDTAIRCIRSAARDAMDPLADGSGGAGEECAMACCAAAMESWRLSAESVERSSLRAAGESPVSPISCAVGSGDGDIRWTTSDRTLVDRKSVFQAHVCPVRSEDMVRRAVDRLIRGSSKIQRATHNMFAYRFLESLPDNKQILKHDNDDDGEDGAGSRLAQLLEMRKEDGVLVLVSRWYGGTHLGPKRFAHIVNVARELLVECHGQGGCLSTAK